MSESEAKHETKTPSRRLERTLAAIIGLILVLAVAGYAAAYFLSPSVIMNPTHTHLHFRMLIINNGKTVDFGQEAFQTDFNKDMCSAALTKQPIHFHDNISQYGHIHWSGITGGLILKNYGWNLIGGVPGELGYRFDKGVLPNAVPIHSNALPTRASHVKYYAYTGTATSHSLKNWDDFLKKPLGVFLSGSQIIEPTEDADTMKADEIAVSTNNVAGNVVIFAQSSAPTAAQVTDAFKTLKPLPTSPCEG